MAASLFMRSSDQYISSEIRLLVIRVSIFFLFLVVMDFAIGGILRNLFFAQKSGKFHRLTYSMDSTTDSIIILGSSYANRHYVPSVFENKLNLSTYNAGMQGQHILFISTLQEIILERFTPGYIILNVDPSWLYESREPYERLADLNPYYYRHKKIINKVIDKEGKFEKFFLLSRFYQYNSTLIHIFRYWIAPQPDQKGYRPLSKNENLPLQDRKLNKTPILSPVQNTRKINRDFYSALENFIKNAQNKHVKVIFVISPNLDYSQNQLDNSFITILKLAGKYSVNVFDFTNDSTFLNKPALFYDRSHLNDFGAHIFSELVSQKIRQYCFHQDTIGH
jgi:hypothetical protein